MFVIFKISSSSTSHKKNLTSVCPYKILPSTFVYEQIWIEIYINANMMKTHNLPLLKHDLKGY